MPPSPLRIEPTTTPAPAILTLTNANAHSPSVCHHAYLKTPILSPTFHRIGANPLFSGRQTLERFRDALSPLHASASHALFDAEPESEITFFKRHPLDRRGNAASMVGFLDKRSGGGPGGGEEVAGPGGTGGDEGKKKKKKKAASNEEGDGEVEEGREKSEESQSDDDKK
ncbi:MAG: hypothetical protein LQ352_008403, partial [Teloschistes flavicans]